MWPWAGLIIGLAMAVWGTTIPMPFMVLIGVLSTAVSFVWVWDRPRPRPQTGDHLTPERESTVTGWDCGEFGHLFEMGSSRCLACECEHEAVDID